MKSGPDVFADALVPLAAAEGARSEFPTHINILMVPGAPRSRGVFARGANSRRRRHRRMLARPVLRRAGGGVWAADWCALCRVPARNFLVRDGYRFAKSEGKPNSGLARKPLPTAHFRDFPADGPRPAFTPHSSRSLNCPSNLIGHDHPNKPANGEGNNGTFLQLDGSRARGGRQTKKGDYRCFRGTSIWMPQCRCGSSAIPDVLFERGLYWASGAFRRRQPRRRA